MIVCSPQWDFTHWLIKCNFYTESGSRTVDIVAKQVDVITYIFVVPTNPVKPLPFGTECRAYVGLEDIVTGGSGTKPPLRCHWWLQGTFNNFRVCNVCNQSWMGYLLYWHLSRHLCLQQYMIYIWFSQSIIHVVNQLHLCQSRDEIYLKLDLPNHKTDTIKILCKHF